MKNNLIGKKRKWWSWHRQRSKRWQWWALPDLRRMLLVSSRSLLSLLSCTSLLSLACSTSAISASFCAHIASLVQVRRRQHACAHDTHTHTHTILQVSHISFSYLFCTQLLLFIISKRSYTHTYHIYIIFSSHLSPKSSLRNLQQYLRTHASGMALEYCLQWRVCFNAFLSFLAWNLESCCVCVCVCVCVTLCVCVCAHNLSICVCMHAPLYECVTVSVSLDLYIAVHVYPPVCISFSLGILMCLCTQASQWRVWAMSM